MESQLALVVGDNLPQVCACAWAVVHEGGFCLRAKHPSAEFAWVHATREVPQGVVQGRKQETRRAEVA